MSNGLYDISILKGAASTVRVTVPLNYSNRFAEHFPLYTGDKILPSSGQIGSSHHFVIHVARHLPHDTQVAYILNFNNSIMEHTRRNTKEAPIGLECVIALASRIEVPLITQDIQKQAKKERR
jgi:hypothetical protein